MGTEDAEADDQGERTPAPVLPLPESEVEHPERQWKERAHEQLPIVARRDVRCDLSAHHVGDSADERAVEAVAERAKESVREKAAEENMNDEAPRHRDVRGHDHTQEESRIENVTVHGGDVRHAAQEIRIPEREMPRRL